MNYQGPEPQYIPFEEEYEDIPEVDLYINGIETEPDIVTTKGFITPSILVDYSYGYEEEEEKDKNIPIVWEVRKNKT